MADLGHNRHFFPAIIIPSKVLHIKLSLLFLSIIGSFLYCNVLTLLNYFICTMQSSYFLKNVSSSLYTFHIVSPAESSTNLGIFDVTQLSIHPGKFFTISILRLTNTEDVESESRTIYHIW